MRKSEEFKLPSRLTIGLLGERAAIPESLALKLSTSDTKEKSEIDEATAPYNGTFRYKDKNEEKDISLRVFSQDPNPNGSQKFPYKLVNIYFICFDAMTERSIQNLKNFLREIMTYSDLDYSVFLVETGCESPKPNFEKQKNELLKTLEQCEEVRNTIFKISLREDIGVPELLNAAVNSHIKKLYRKNFADEINKNSVLISKRILREMRDTKWIYPSFAEKGYMTNGKITELSGKDSYEIPNALKGLFNKVKQAKNQHDFTEISKQAKILLNSGSTSRMFSKVIKLSPDVTAFLNKLKSVESIHDNYLGSSFIYNTAKNLRKDEESYFSKIDPNIFK